MRYQYTPIRTPTIKAVTIPNVGKNVKILDLSNNVGVNMKWCSLLVNILSVSLKVKLIALLGIFPRKLKTCVHTKIYKCLFTALFLIAKN